MQKLSVPDFLTVSAMRHHLYSNSVHTSTIILPHDSTVAHVEGQLNWHLVEQHEMLPTAANS
jgi:hypothetical protein